MPLRRTALVFSALQSRATLLLNKLLLFIKRLYSQTAFSFHLSTNDKCKCYENTVVYIYDALVVAMDTTRPRRSTCGPLRIISYK